LALNWTWAYFLRIRDAADSTSIGLPGSLKRIGIELKVFKMKVIATLFLLLFLLLQIDLDLHQLILLCSFRLLFEGLFKMKIVQLVECFFHERLQIEEIYLSAR
jgi:hypothetical protein